MVAKPRKIGLTPAAGIHEHQACISQPYIEEVLVQEGHLWPSRAQSSAERPAESAQARQQLHPHAASEANGVQRRQQHALAHAAAQVEEGATWHCVCQGAVQEAHKGEGAHLAVGEVLAVQAKAERVLHTLPDARGKVAGCEEQPCALQQLSLPRARKHVLVRFSWMSTGFTHNGHGSGRQVLAQARAEALQKGILPVLLGSAVDRRTKGIILVVV
mmetsp:Transcript_65537/g.152224  ORF Transcript_65537/g.152224 Transcript_65537/m.152224 type:complete len:216 (-) Transcript_65537:146-793(-)